MSMHMRVYEMSVNEWVLEIMDVLEETVRSYEAVKLRIK